MTSLEVSVENVENEEQQLKWSGEQSTPPSEQEVDQNCGPSDADKANMTPKDKKMSGALQSLMKQMVSSKQPFYRMSLPICFSEPRSLLEKFTDMGRYMELFIQASKQDNEEKRFLEVIKFYLSSWLVQQDVRTPFNPIIGEIFNGNWTHGDGSTTEYNSEQISHHPPSSAFCYTNVQNGLVFHSYLSPTSKFWGNSFESSMEGKLVMELPRRGEEYVVDVPKIAVRGVVLGTMATEVIGSTTLACKKTGYFAEIEFKGKGNLFKSKHFMTAKIRHPSNKRSLYSLEAGWDGKINIITTKTNETSLFFDINAFTTSEIVVPAASEQSDNFSRKVWSGVTYHINADNEEEAQTQKYKVEEIQRQAAKERGEGAEWSPSTFQKSTESNTHNSYIFKKLANIKLDMMASKGSS
ncbi:hypothetical protein SAMD00019534_047560 [Acytostelium subglobosum LB1]|uniref:hypothetical protein n=1 Tax=Acytostelium subglobosum LB1 TaxID=1410327 RepID=UPI000644A636|nr:hypothetical protein SAMD00019534_047560 [Acytostelium subglobosum LB1]GAM21581.1 hypothetical protein SAMD00019534_047560 [Acytostelium subglobosum LB1]|eukprot:XP_012755700.1 hypothetical protein SAMD00019534_047560 [Acytostelium subglobosum LB1]